MLRLAIVAVAVLFVVILAGLLLLGARSRRQPPNGWLEERLGACGGTPNCVSSRDGRPSHHVDALPVAGDPEEAFRRAAEAVRALPGAVVELEESGYLHAECSSSIFGFIDDVELELDSVEGSLHVRSASRVGKSDLGANRRRVERLRAALIDS